MGSLGGTSSQRSEAFRAASDLVQVSRRGKTKHGRSPAACKSNADGFEMEYVVGGQALMAEGAVGRSCLRCGANVLSEGAVDLR